MKIGVRRAGCPGNSDKVFVLGFDPQLPHLKQSITELYNKVIMIMFLSN